MGRKRDVETFINIFDIAVLSSHTEGISNAILEYMALGKPVIASRGGGTSELVLDNVTGFLTQPCAANAMYEKILLLLENKKLRLKLGNMGRERIMNEFNFRKMLNSFFKIYNTLLIRENNPR